MKEWRDPTRLKDEAYLRKVRLALCVMQSGSVENAFRAGAIGIEQRANDALRRLQQCNSPSVTVKWVAERQRWHYVILAPHEDVRVVKIVKDQLLSRLKNIADRKIPTGFECEDSELFVSITMEILQELLRSKHC